MITVPAAFVDDVVRREGEAGRRWLRGLPVSVASCVAIRDTLPTGIQFVRWISNPGNACGVTSGVVSCTLGTLASGASGQVAFTVRANAATMPGTGTAQMSRNTAVIGPGPDPTSSTPWPGDTPSNNTSSTDTSIQFPDPSISIFINPAPSSSDPEKLPVGEWGSIDVAYGNSGAGVARSSSLTVASTATRAAERDQQ